MRLGAAVEMTAEIVALVIAVGVVAGMCDRFGWPTPLILVVVGAAASFLPHGEAWRWCWIDEELG